jgi:hypothetical protein
MIFPITQPITREQFRETARAFAERYGRRVSATEEEVVHDFIDWSINNFYLIVPTATVQPQQLQKPRRLFNRHDRRRMALETRNLKLETAGGVA